MRGRGQRLWGEFFQSVFSSEIFQSGKTIAIRHLAVQDTGPNVSYVGSIVLRGLRPHHKAQLLERLNDMDLVTVMCGDGANDCGVRAVLLRRTDTMQLCHAILACNLCTSWLDIA